MKSFQKYQFHAAFFCLAIALILWLMEVLFIASSKSSHKESQYAFEELAYFIHYLTGYKIIFPAIGLITAAGLAYILRNLLTKKEERP